MTRQPKIENWFKRITGIIQELSDLEFQKKIFNGEDGLWSSPVELCSIALDDYLLEEWFEAHKRKLPVLLQDEFKHLISAACDAPNYDEEHETVDSILYSPEWIELRAIAEAVYQQLQALPEDEFNNDNMEN